MSELPASCGEEAEFTARVGAVVPIVNVCVE